MNKHFLLSVSDDKTFFWGARFLADFMRNKEDVEVTIYYSIATQMLRNSMPSYAERLEMTKTEERRAQKGQVILNQARDFLAGLGFNEDNLHLKLGLHNQSTAYDILNEVERGLYDAIVLGRRGLGRLEEFVQCSVSRDLLALKGTAPIWICREPVQGRRHVLACVDDSEQSDRMIDHVGFVLEDEPEHEVTLLNVYDPNSEDRMFAEEIFAKSRELMAENGFPLERVHSRIVESYSPAKAILRVVSSGNYAVVAAGRKGEDHGLMHNLFMGSVSSTLFRQVKGAALWLCH